MYQGIFFGVVAVLCALLWVGRETSDSKVDTKGAALRWRYLTVFLVFKLGDWMQGPYFHEMYSTKVGQAEVAMLFLMAFVSATIGSLAVGKALDTYGGKAGSIAFAVLFSASGLTALSNDYNVLMLGRILGGVAASLLNTSPETWLISEIQHQSLPSSFTDYIFSWMYFSDGIVAVIAGWVADGAVSQTSDVTSPFITSSVITVIGGVLCFFLWPTNKKGTNTSTAKSPKLHLGSMAALVVTQAFFESAMYVFVLNWGKAVSSADSGSVPYGTIFSAFMTSTMIGTTVASFLMKKSFQAAQLLTFSAAIGFSGLVLALYSLDNPYALVVSFCMYEAAVGVYFPSIGCLRAQLIPEASRGMLMNMCRVPLNLMVITAMLYYEALGVEGGLKLCITALVLMCIATLYLHSNTVKMYRGGRDIRTMFCLLIFVILHIKLILQVTMRALLLIFACTAVSGDIPLKSNSYSSLFGAKRGKARNQGVRVISDLAATVNDLVEGMLWSDYGTGLENQNVGDMVMKKMMRGLGRKGSKEPTMEEVRANSKECKASVNQEEHNSHVTKHDEVKTRKAVALQTSTTEEEDVDLTEDQRKAYEKQQEELANSLNQVQERVFCTNGLKVYPNATFVCDGSSASIGSLEWLAMSEVDRSKCQASSDTTSCVCPRDINPSVISGVAACDQDVAMFCTVNITTPSINECPPYVYNLDWLKPCHWYSVQDTLSVSVTLTCTFNFSEPTFEGLNIDEKYITEDYGGGSYSVKTVEEVRNTSFPQRAVGMADELGLSPGNWLLGNISGTLGIPHKFTYKLYNFNRPGDNAWRFDTDIADFEPGQLTGEKPFTYSIDLATVPARYYQGGRIYSEAGLLFSPNHTAKLLIDFIDYDPVAIGSSSDSQLAGYVIFIVLTCIFVVAGAGFMWLNTKVRIRELNHNLE